MTRNVPGCCCGTPCGTLTIHVLYCGGDLPGAVVELLSGTTVVGSCTTDSTGICTIPIPAAGTYTLRASRLHYTTQEFAVSLTCGNATRSFTLVAAPGFVNLAQCVEPWASDPTTFLFDLTDDLGTTRLAYLSQGGSPITYTYVGCRSFITRWGRNADCTGDPPYGDDKTVTSAVYYLLSLSCTTIGLSIKAPLCNTGGLGNFSLRAVPATCGPGYPAMFTQSCGGSVGSKSCPPAFALTGTLGCTFGGGDPAPLAMLGIIYDNDNLSTFPAHPFMVTQV